MYFNFIGDSKMKVLKLFVTFTLLCFITSVQASGLWALSGQIVLSGTAIGNIPVSVPITSVADGHYFSESSCKAALNELMLAPVTRATSSSVGLYYDAFTVINGVPVGTPGSEMKFNPLANVTKTVMAECVPIGQ